MGFTFETQYDQKSLAAMAKGIRSTIRKKRNRRSHIFGVIVIILAVLLTMPALKGEVGIRFNTVITWLAALIIAFVLLFEDQINGYAARRRMLTGMQNSSAVFEDEKYTISTEFGKSEFHYANISHLAETGDYFIFIFDMSHAQIYDKNTMTGGSEEDFRVFIKGKTGKEIQTVK